MQATPITFVGAGGLALAGDAYGDPAALPVVLLHGGGQTRFAWGDTAAAIGRDGWYAVALDLRGHGESAWAPDADYSVDAFVEDVRSVLAQLPRRAVVVGASLGGVAALVAEGERPGSMAGLVLVDVATRLEVEGASRIRQFMMARPDGFASLEEAADVIAAYLPHRPRPKDLSGLERNLRRDAEGRYRWHWDPLFMTGDRPAKDVINTDRLRAAALGVRVPTLLVRGRMSDILSEQGAREFLALVPHARYADVSGAGHMVAGDRNDNFSAAVREFLGALDRAG